MHVEFGNMARELGIRPDAIRIMLGIPTRLQKLIRSAASWEEIVSLSSEFREDRSFNSCGPTYESEELKEYEARRDAFFAVYLDKFETIENFDKFGQDPTGRHIANGEETRLGADKLCRLFRRKIDEASSLPEGALDSLVEIFYSRSEFYDRHHDTSSISAVRAREYLLQNLRRAFLSEVAAAQTQGVKETILVFDKLGKRIGKEDLGARGPDYPWRTIWLNADGLENLLLIEEGVSPTLLDEDAVDRRAASFMPEFMEKIKSFSEALVFAQGFASWDGYHASDAYSEALIGAAKKVENEDDALAVLKAWEDRSRGRTYNPDNPWPGLPKVILEKWDEIFLEKIEVTDDLTRLAQLLETSPFGSRSYKAAKKRLDNHFETLMAQARTEEDADKVYMDAMTLSRWISVDEGRKKTIVAERHAEKVRTLWETLERGDELEKTALIGLFHEFKEKEPEKARKVLVALAKHFPAESVEEIVVTQ